MRALAVVTSLMAVALPRTGGGGITVPVPAGWHAFRVTHPVDHVTDPAVRAVVASGPIHLYLLVGRRAAPRLVARARLLLDGLRATRR